MGSAATMFHVSQESCLTAAVDVLLIPVFQQGKASEKPSSPQASADKAKTEKTSSLIQTPLLKELDKQLQGAGALLCQEEKFDGSKEKILVIRKAPSDTLLARRVVLVGLGEALQLTVQTLEKSYKKAVEAILKLEGLQSVAVLLPENAPLTKLSLQQNVSTVIDAVYQATYSSLEAKEPVQVPEHLTVFASAEVSITDLKEAVKVAESFATARSRAKDLVNMPANLKTTLTLADEAQYLSELPNIKVSVQTDVEWIKKEMPSFYTVAKGNLVSDPPKFIAVHYKPESGEIKQHIALVGKSVIFDTGGYQVKPGDSMVTMKGDMTGGATVLQVMRALSELQPQHISVSAYCAATPNKIDSDAMIPDSIIGSTCGKKIEIRHTDAEGRLTLIDAVAKAALATAEHPQPDIIVTMATLTGSAMRAVGLAIAAMANNEEWREKVVLAAKKVGDPIQTLDVIEQDYEDIKSKLDGADIINTSYNKNRGAQSAAAFVMSGAPEGIPLVHLDIAGADMTADEKATGIGCKTLIQFVLDVENQF